MKKLIVGLFLSIAIQAAQAATVPKTATVWYQDGCVQYWVHHDTAALEDLQHAASLDPDAPMPHLMLSRTYMRMSQPDKASSECKLAVDHVQLVTDVEGYLIKSWAARMLAATDVTQRSSAWDTAWRTADTGIALYPNSTELYLLCGEMEENPVRAAPYFIAALNIDPSHPFSQRWQRPNMPIPKVNCGPGEVVKPTDKPPKLFTGLGQVHHPITAHDPKVQQYFEQGMCCLYAYVYPDAEQAFEAAIKLDPNCPMAYWGLSFSTGTSHLPLPVAEKALALANQYGTESERWYCTLRVLQLQKRNDQFLYALCGALIHFPKDVDLWVWRATYRGFLGETGDDGRTLNGIPFDLAALRLQPDHPSANHELVHGYEIIDRPMLGWPYSWGFRRSAPNLPHAQHMQAHLAMRLGRWKEALACTRESIRLSDAGFPELDKEHHRNILMWALGHEGCFKEAMVTRHSKSQDLSWPRMLRLKLDDDNLAKFAAGRQGPGAGGGDGWYLGALADLDRGHWQAAKDKLQHFDEIRGVWYGADINAWRDEVQARIAFESGKRDEAVAQMRGIAKWVDGTADTSAEAHRWGQGSYYDDLWGELALGDGKWDDAQEGFAEGLAHEHGDVVAALGLQVVWEHKHNPDLVKHYQQRAAEIWAEADPGASARLLARLQAIADRKAWPF